MTPLWLWAIPALILAAAIAYSVWREVTRKPEPPERAYDPREPLAIDAAAFLREEPEEYRARVSRDGMNVAPDELKAMG